MVGVSVADDDALAVDRAVCGLAGDLCTSVAVEVVHHELRVVRALPDIDAQVDAPEHRAVEPVRFEDRRVGDARSRVVLTAAGLVQDDLILAIAVEIAHRGIVGLPPWRRLQGHGDVRKLTVCGGQDVRGRWRPFHAVRLAPNVVGCVSRGRRRRRHEHGPVGNRDVVQASGTTHAVPPVDVECDIGRIGGEQAPSDMD